MKLIDVHQHVMNERETQRAVDTAKKLGIPKVYVSCIHLPGMGYYSTGNDVELCNYFAYEFCEKNSEIFRPFTYLNPALPTSAQTLKKGVLEHGSKGAKLEISAYHDSEFVNPIAEMCIELGVPVKLHTWHKFYNDNCPTESDAYRVANLAKRYPELIVHMAHMGGDTWYSLKAVADLPNVYVDVASANRPSSDIEYAVKLIGSERMMFGTDAPDSGSVLITLGRVEEAMISERDRENILWRTASKLYHEDLGD